MTAILAQARAMSYEVGSNLKGAGIGAAWTSLLPQLDIDAALVLGRIADAERVALGRLASHVVQINDSRDRDALARSPTDMLAGHSLTLIRIGGGGVALLQRVPGLGPALASLLSPNGCIFLDGEAQSEGVPPILMGELRASEQLLIAPRFGTIRAILPAGDPGVMAIFEELGYLPPKGRQVRAATVANRIIGRVPRWAQRHAEFAISVNDLPLGLPRYVREVAEGDGHPLAPGTWGLLAQGDYASQKVLLLHIDQGERQPSSIVKLSTDPRHVARLENEAASLRAVATLDLPPVGRVPRVLFSGEHAGRGVVGEEWIRGRLLRSLVSAGDDSCVSHATTWLTGLGYVTAQPRSAQDVGAALRDLLDRFGATFVLPANDMAVLEDCIGAIERHPGPVPVVRQHGDPGAWNMLVDDAGRIVVLDWESSESEGMPLWDLFYFQRSVGALVARRQGVRRGVDGALRHLVTPTPVQAQFAADVAAHAERLGLHRSLVEPMFYACWMHRALKEATRRRAAKLDGAHYLRLLRELIAHRDAPALRRLTGNDRTR